MYVLLPDGAKKRGGHERNEHLPFDVQPSPFVGTDWAADTGLCIGRKERKKAKKGTTMRLCCWEIVRAVMLEKATEKLASETLAKSNKSPIVFSLCQREGAKEYEY